jgi:hypothetical protein
MIFQNGFYQKVALKKYNTKIGFKCFLKFKRRSEMDLFEILRYFK